MNRNYLYHQYPLITKLPLSVYTSFGTHTGYTNDPEAMLWLWISALRVCALDVPVEKNRNSCIKNMKVGVIMTVMMVKIYVIANSGGIITIIKIKTNTGGFIITILDTIACLNTIINR